MSEIENILRANLDSWDIKQYSDKNDFESLWEIGARNNAQPIAIQEKNEQRTEIEKILIIWDGFPDQPAGDIPIRQFITPTDWVLAYFLKYESQNLRIVILDVYSHESEYVNHVNNEIREFHKSSLDGMKNWVKFYSFNKEDFGNNVCSPLEIIDDLKQDIQIQQVDSQRLKDLSKDWENKINNTANQMSIRHNMSNIFGPIMLAKSLPTRLYEEMHKHHISRERDAFYNNLKWHNIVQEYGRSEEGDKDLVDRKTRVILIDDQAKDGWADLLSGWIYNEVPNSKISIRENADSIVSKLEETLESQLETIPLDLRFSNNGGETIDEILLFDLYLFPSGSDHETSYFAQVLDLAILLTKDEDLSFDINEDLGELKKKVRDSEFVKTNRMRYLTLLPRVIAEIAPSIPIIIFSATKLTDQLIGSTRTDDNLLNQYENIQIFSKPTVFSTTEAEAMEAQRRDYAIATREKFKEEFGNAMNFVKARRRSRILYKNALTSLKDYKTSNTNFGFPGNLKGQKVNVALYIDESGKAGITENFRIGGIYVIGPADQAGFSTLENKVESRTLEKIKTEYRGNNEIEGNLQSAHLIDIEREADKHKDNIRNEYLDKLRSWYKNNSNNFYIRAINLNYQNDTFKINGLVEIVTGIVNKICRDIPPRSIQLAIDKGEANHFIDKGEVIKFVAGIPPQHNEKRRSHIEKHFDAKFNKILRQHQNQNIVENIVKRYTDGRSNHIDMLRKLAKLLLQVLLPILKETYKVDIQSVTIKYGTLIRTTTKVIADAIRSTGGINNTSINNFSSTIFLVGGEALDIKLVRKYGEGHNYGVISCEGLRNYEFCNCHRIADAVISRDPSTNRRVRYLYDYYGMDGCQETNNEIDKWMNPNFISDIVDDTKWTQIEGMIGTRNNVESYILTRIGRCIPDIFKNNPYPYSFVDKYE